jgi:cell division protease FtsH
MGFSFLLIIVTLGIKGYDGFFRHNSLFLEKHKRQRQDFFVSYDFFSNKQKYPFSSNYFENYIRRLNSKNVSIQIESILEDDIHRETYKTENNHTIKNENPYFDFEITIHNNSEEEEDEQDYSIPEVFVIAPKNKEPHSRKRRKMEPFSHFFNKEESTKKKKSENFEILEKSPITFQDIGGYDTIKKELHQCIDILKNYTKYTSFNVRTPKGLILEGPPGNGKTMIAKGLAGEANASFIAVSGSEFQEKYVGVGASRVRELFQLAQENIPCVIFLDEIDAIGRKRSTESDSSNAERDSTLNQLLVNMDGFQSKAGIFIIGATNRADLLDPALVRPGRIDKRVFIGLPDEKTREAILRIHIKGKPHDTSVKMEDLIEITNGLSGAQLENLLNEAMLYAIRDNRCIFTQTDIETVMNRILVGWQPTEHKFTVNMLEQIAIHEMGHAIVGLLAKHHSKMTKVVINLSSPQSPGYTVFEGSTNALYTREALFEHLMILLAGRIAEEVFYNVSVTTGAINDFEEALKLAQKMVIYYGMGRNLIYPSLSEKYKEKIDQEVIHLIQDAYSISNFIIKNCKEVIIECAGILNKDKIIKAEHILKIVTEKYPAVLQLYTK